MHELKDLVVYSLSKDYVLCSYPAVPQPSGLEIKPDKGIWILDGWAHLIGRPRYKWHQRFGYIGVFNRRIEEHQEEINNIKNVAGHLARKKR
jgi:hypothetical protein